MRVDRRTFLKIAGAGSASLALAACGTTAQEPAADEEPAEDAEPVAVRTAALKGPTAMGLVRFMSEVDAGNLADNDYTFEIYAAPDEITPLIAKEGVDIAAVPANLAATLYNKTEGGVRVIAINTLGVLYICELGDTVRSVEDLRGKTIYASGKGSTPEYGLQYVLEKNGLTVGEDVQIEWKSEHAECVQALATAEGEAVAMLPQPFVTTAQAQNDKIRVALDLTEEWDRVQTGDETSSMITGVAVVRSAFADENPAAVDAMLHVIWDNPMLSVNLSLMPILMEAALRTGDQTMVDRAREIRASVSQEILDCTNELSEISVSAESVLPCDLSQARLAQMSAVLLRLCGNAHVYLVKIRAERPVYAVLLEETADKKSVSEYAFSLLSNYCTELTRLEEIYYLYREDSNSAVMQEARKIGIRLT